jgi:hypothetical protein
MQLKLEDFENIPSELLETVSENDFFQTLNSGQDAQQKAQAPENPAPKVKEDNFFNQNQPFDMPGEGQEPGKTNVKADEIISGELATELLNKILPVLLSLGVERFLNIKAPKKNFELTASEKSTISPILEKCLSNLNISFENPFIALGLSLSFVYGSKIIDVANNPDLAKTVKQSAAKVTNASNPAPTSKAGTTRKPGETRGRKPKAVNLDIGV